MFELEFRAASRVHMMEGWLRTFTAGFSSFPGCAADGVVALADEGAWSVHVDPGPANDDDGIAFALDKQRRKVHWGKAQEAISRCQSSSRALAEAAAEGDRDALPVRLEAFFTDYIAVQAYYQASSDRFTRGASQRYAGGTQQPAGFGTWSGGEEFQSASLTERRAWRKLRARASEDGWSEGRVEEEVRRHAAEYGSSLAGATADGERIVASLLRSLNDHEARPAPTRRPAATGEVDELYSALLELGRQRLTIREGFTVAGRASAEVLRDLAYAGLGDQVSPEDKLTLWKSVTMGELRSSAEGLGIDPVVVSERRRCGLLVVGEGLEERAGDEAAALRELVRRDSIRVHIGPLRGLVGFRGDARIAEGRAFVLAPGRSPEANVELCEQGLRDGDILVTGMTHPWLVPACTRAAGIVTDLGGVTCHAVVVAIELGIPCVVGTGHSTEVLSTGDRIVLDLVSGTVRKEATR